MPHRILCWLALMLWGGVAAAATPPQRIASLNLCTDQLLLMLVDRSRIASVSYWAVKPDASYMAEEAAGLPINHGLAEEIVPLQPDLVIAGRYTDTGSINLLRRLGYRVEIVEVPTSLTETAAHIREVANLVGEPEAGEALLARMQQRMDRLQKKAASRPPRLAAVYAPNGISAGRGTLIDEMLHMAGLRNLAAERGMQGYGHLPLEQLLAARPDVLVLDSPTTSNRDSLAHHYLQHPALARGLAHTVRVDLPPRLSVCVGPMVVDALERLVDA